MKIGMITQWFDPERGSAAQAGNIARSLVRQGMDVTVLTGFPNYPTGVIYPGYRQRAHDREVRDGVTVHRVPLYASHDNRAVRRAANYLSFASSATLGAPLLLGGSDAVLVHLTPATAAIPAMGLRLLRRVPFVIHVQDLWPDTVVSSGFVQDGSAGRMERALHAYCDRMYAAAHGVAVTSPGMAERIAARGVPERKIRFAPNWADEKLFHPVPADSAVLRELGGDPARFTVMYAGNLGEFQALDLLLTCAAQLRDRRDIQFLIVGDGVMAGDLRAQAKRLELDNVIFAPAQPFERMAQVLAVGDVHYVGLQDLPVFRITLPSKIQASLAVGRPLLGSLAGDAARVIENSGAGRCCPPGDASALSGAIRELVDDPEALRTAGIQAVEHYRAYYSESASSGVLRQMLQAAAAQRMTRRPRG